MSIGSRVRRAIAWRARRSYFRSRALREAVAGTKIVGGGRATVPDLAHVLVRGEVPDGPVQRDEALLLHGVIRITRPRTVVEVGFLRGDSALNFLLALDAEARLYTFDNDPQCERVAAELFGHDPRLVFRRIGQDELAPHHVDDRPIDFLFLDASHDFELNKRTFEGLHPALAPQAILGVHDTGTVHRSLVPAGHHVLAETDRWAGDEYEGQPGQRAFVNWMRESHPEFAQVHLHTHRVHRCGITLLQRSEPLRRPGGRLPAT